MSATPATTTAAPTKPPMASDEPMPPPPPRRGGSLALVAVIVVVVLVGGYAAGAAVGHWWPFGSGSSGPCGAPKGTIQGAGSTFVNPLMQDWSQTYYTDACVQVNYASVGSGSGITELTNKLLAFGASDAPLSPAQRGLLPGPALTVPEAAGAVVLTYNLPGVAGGLNLTGAVVAGIYLGTITTWNDAAIQSLNPKVSLPSTNILPVWRSDASGTSFAFTSYLCQESQTWNASFGKGISVAWPVGTGEKGSTGVAGEVSSYPGAIGYVELTYALFNNLGYANIENPAGNFVKASLATTAAAVTAGSGTLPAGSGDWYNVTLLNEPGADTYPIATFTYLMVYHDPGVVYGSDMSQGQATLLVQFLWWVVHSGQSESQSLFFVPLPANVVSLDETTIGEVQYNGGSLTSH